MNNKICIAKPNVFSYSETFIDNQIANVHHDLLIFDGWHPISSKDKGLIVTGLLKHRFFRGILKKHLPKLYNKLYNKQLSAFLKNQNIEIVLANYGVLGSNIIEACKQNKIKLYVHFHGFDATHKHTILKYKKAYLNMFEYATKFVSVSNIMTENLVQLGLDKNKIVRIPYGVNFDKFMGKSKWESNKKIFFVGRFTAKKAPNLLIKAFLKVLNTHPDAELNMIGDGELFEETKSYITSLNITNNVILHGKQNPDYIVNALKEAQIFMQHSIIAPNGDSEGTPNTILEASAMGIPIVSTKHAGIIEAVIDEETGYLVDEQDWEAMGEKAILLLNDIELCKTMGAKGKLHIFENYNLIQQSQKLQDLISN